MPVLWFAKDGPSKGATTGNGIKLTFPQLAEIFEDYHVQYLSEEPPSINKENPSKYPNRVVVHIANDERAHGKYPHAGYYFFPDLSPQKAGEILKKSGIKLGE